MEQNNEPCAECEKMLKTHPTVWWDEGDKHYRGCPNHPLSIKTVTDGTTKVVFDKDTPRVFLDHRSIEPQESNEDYPGDRERRNRLRVAE